MFKLANCRCCAPQTKKPKILGKWGQKIGLVGELFVKFSKIVTKFFIHNKKLISCHSRQFKILQKKILVIALIYTPRVSAPLSINQRSQFTHLASSLAVFCRLYTKSGAMCEKTEIFKLQRIQLKCRNCFHSNFLSKYDMSR